MSTDRAPSVQTAEVVADDANLSLSASVIFDRDLKLRVDEIERALNHRDFTLAATILVELFNADATTLIQSGTSYLNARMAALSILNRFPAEALATYQRITREQAVSSLNTARETVAIDGLLEVVHRFPKTAAGDHAVLSAARYFRDVGQVAEAERLVQESQRLGRTTGTLDFSYEAPEANQERAQLAENWLPSVVSRWESTRTLPPATDTLRFAVTRDLREHGLLPLEPWTGVSIDNAIVFSGLHGLRAVERETGKTLWERSSLVESNPWLAAHLGELAQAMFGQSLFSQPAADGRYIYLVEPTSQTQSPQPISSPIGPHTLVCLHAESGDEVWLNSEIFGRTGHALSPPAVSGQELLIVAELGEQEPAIVLLAIDRETGQLVRSLTLCKPIRPIDAALQPGGSDPGRTESDLRRRNLACPIEIHEELAYCPTGAGMLAVVHLSQWRVEWAYRYPRDDIPAGESGAERPAPGAISTQWWMGWQRVRTRTTETVTVCVSPESESVHCLDARSGELLWRVARGDGVDIATVNEAGALVIGANSARLLDLQDGHTRWELPLNCPNGFGFRDREFYFVPDGEIGWTRIHLDTGESTTSRFNLNPRLTATLPVDMTQTRNFIFEQGAVYEITATGIRQLQDLQRAHESNATTAVSQLLKFIEHEELHQLDANLFIDSESQLGRIAKDAIFQMLMPSDGNHSHDVPEEKRAEIVRRLKVDPVFEAKWLATEIRSTIEDKDWPKISRFLSEELTESISRQEIVSDRRLKVRLECSVAGLLQRSWENAASSDQMQLEHAVRQAIRSRALDEPGEVRWLQHMFAGTHWDGLIEEIRTDLIASTDDTTAEHSDAWPVTSPKLTVRQRMEPFLPVDAIPMESSVHASDWDVSIETPARDRIRFSGPHWRGSWSVTLPKTMRNLRHQSELLQGWSIKNGVVLQLGSEIFAVNPLDQDGDPGARLVWPPTQSTIDTLGDRPNHLLTVRREPVEKPLGFPGTSVRYFNELGQPMTAVGPVLDRYFCIRQKGMLIAFRTHTGQELWRMFDIPAESIVLGDDHHIAVVDMRTDQILVYAAIDGRLVNEISLHVDPSAVFMTHGTHILQKAKSSDSPPSKEGLTLQWIDTTTREMTWERSWEGEWTPFQVDVETVGVVSSGGAIELLRLGSGETFNQAHIVGLPKVERIVCSLARSDALIVFSGEVQDDQLLNARQSGNSDRSPFLNGIGVLLSRASGEVLWQRELASTILPLDQPFNLPVFVTAESRLSDEVMDSPLPLSRVRLFDRQTGELLYEEDSHNPVPAYDVQGNLEDLRIELKTRSAVVTLDYSP